MEKLLVSMMRFSTAVTLFGMEQFQNAMNTMTGTEDVSRSVDRFRKTLDSLTDSVVRQMEEGSREAVDSMARMSRDTVQRTFEGMSVTMMDPRDWMRMTTDFMKKTTDSMADFVSTETESESEEPVPASEALSKSDKEESGGKSKGKK